jgi:hypothetical protein
MRPVHLLVPLLFCLILVSCRNDELIAPMGQAPLTPRDLAVTAVDARTIDARWCRCPDSVEITGWLLSWRSAESADSGSIVLPPDSARARASVAEAGGRYTVYLRAANGAALSPPAIATVELERDDAYGDSPFDLHVWLGLGRELEIAFRPPLAMEPTAYDVTIRSLRWGATSNATLGPKQHTVILYAPHSCDSVVVEVRARYGMRRSAPVRSDAISILGERIDNPHQVTISSLSESALRVGWQRRDATGYIVVWNEVGSSSRDSLRTLDLSTVVDRLRPGVRYEISVFAEDSCGRSDAATMIFATARRLTTFTDGTPIRLYETASTRPHAMLVDPDRGGPIALSTALGSPRLGDVQLALHTSSGEKRFAFGPAAGIAGYPAHESFDQNVVAFGGLMGGGTLEDTGLPDSIHARYFEPPIGGREHVFDFFSDSDPSGLGRMMMFAFRGSDGMHYARVFVRNGGGMLLQGTAPNRYVELEISYQMVGDMPFAGIRGRADGAD